VTRSRQQQRMLLVVVVSWRILVKRRFLTYATWQITGVLIRN